MHCSACAMSIDGDLEDLDGVSCATTNYAKSETEIEFDERRVNADAILSQVKVTGYRADIT